MTHVYIGMVLRNAQCGGNCSCHRRALYQKRLFVHSEVGSFRRVLHVAVSGDLLAKHTQDAFVIQDARLLTKVS